MLGALTAGTAQADGVAPLPLSFQIEDHPIQKVPTTFKFQARVSQGKIPSGDGMFDLNVHLKSAGKDICSESLKQVRVLDSVLNVEIGRNMNCQLDEVMATYADLSFQICIKNDENCLKPIAMSTVPYAVKASYAAQAQVAHQSDIAAQCNYAHRVSADDDLALLSDIGSGYYDFHTPTGTDLIMIDGQSVEGGFIQWTPVTATNKLNVCAKAAKTGELQKLAEFAVHAEMTRVVSQLQVGGALKVNGDSTFAGDATFNKSLSVAGAMKASAGAQIDQGLYLSGTSGFAKGSTFQFDGDVVFTGNVTLPQGKVVAGNSVDSSAVVDGSLQSVDIADGTLQSVDIADGTIATADLADGSVANGKLASSAADSRVILDNSVRSTDIQDGTILGADVAASQLSGSHIVDGSITGADVAGNTLGGGHIVDGSITGADVAGETLTGNHIANGTVGYWDIGNSQIYNNHIADGQVTNADLAARSVTSDKVAFSPRRVAYTHTGWSSYYTGIYTSQNSVCALIGMQTLDATQGTGSCNIFSDGNGQWYLWGHNATCSYFCF